MCHSGSPKTLPRTLMMRDSLTILRHSQKQVSQKLKKIDVFYGANPLNVKQPECRHRSVRFHFEQGLANTGAGAGVNDQALFVVAERSDHALVLQLFKACCQKVTLSFI